MAVGIKTEPRLSAGRPRLLFEGAYWSFGRGRLSRSFDLSPDGQTFVMIEREEQATLTQIHVVQNWFEELKRLVPTN